MKSIQTIIQMIGQNQAIITGSEIIPMEYTPSSLDLHQVRSWTWDFWIKLGHLKRYNLGEGVAVRDNKESKLFWSGVWMKNKRLPGEFLTTACPHTGVGLKFIISLWSRDLKPIKLI